MSTTEQRKTIGYLRSLLNLDEELYREMLFEYGVISSKELSDLQAEQLLRNLKKTAVEIGVYKPLKKYAFQKYKYENSGTRAGMATPKQKRKIEVMWFGVSTKKDEKSRKKALSLFIKRLTGKEHIEFITNQDVRIFIKALEKMKERKGEHHERNKP